MLASLLAAVWLLAGDGAALEPPPSPTPATTASPATTATPAGPVTAASEASPVPRGSGPAKSLFDSPPAPPARLPLVESEPPALRPLTPEQIRRIVILPAASVVSGIVVPIALGLRGGDWGTPMVEELAGWGGGYLGLGVAVGLTAAVEGIGPVPDPKVGFNRAALGVAGVGVIFLVPAATGAAVWLTGEGMQGRSLHPSQNLAVAMGGAFGTELLLAGSAVALHQEAGAGLQYAFIPLAAGATLSYDLARGARAGPRRADFPVLAFRF